MLSNHNLCLLASLQAATVTDTVDLIAQRPALLTFFSFFRSIESQLRNMKVCREGKNTSYAATLKLNVAYNEQGTTIKPLIIIMWRVKTKIRVAILIARRVRP